MFPFTNKRQGTFPSLNGWSELSPSIRLSVSDGLVLGGHLKLLTVIKISSFVSTKSHAVLLAKILDRILSFLSASESNRLLLFLRSVLEGGFIFNDLKTFQLFYYVRLYLKRNRETKNFKMFRINLNFNVLTALILSVKLLKLKHNTNSLKNKRTMSQV